jgi:hypothetical protein
MSSSPIERSVGERNVPPKLSDGQRFSRYLWTALFHPAEFRCGLDFEQIGFLLRPELRNFLLDNFDAICSADTSDFKCGLLCFR